MKRNHWVVLGVLLLFVLLFLGWCRSLYPDEAGAKREVERVIPPHMAVVEITGDDCGLPIAASCNIQYSLEGNPDDYVSDARLIRGGLLDNGWEEMGYSETDPQAGGTFRKGSMTLALTIRSVQGLETCVGAGCQSSITVTPR